MSEWKETEVGRIPNRWKVQSASEFCLAVKDGTHDSPKQQSEGEFLITSRHISNGNIDLTKAYKISREEFDKANRRSKVDKWDVLLTMIGTVGEVVLVRDEPNFAIKNIGLFKCGEERKAQWLTYFLKSPYGKGLISTRQAGTTQEYITLDHLRNLPIFIPPDSEKVAIIKILSSLDDKIDLLHRQNKTLEALAETLFRQWFVEEAGEGYENGKLGEFIEVTLGGEWGKENPEGDYNFQVQCIRGTDIGDLWDGLPLRAPTRFVKLSKYNSVCPQDGDLIMEISGGSDDQSTGRTIYLNQDVQVLFKSPVIFSNFCRLIRPKKKEFSLFLFSYIKHLYNQGDLFNLENGSSGIRNLNYKALLYELDYPIPKPSKILIYNTKVVDFYRKIDLNKIQILKLTQLRDTLLPKLMSGEVRVGNKR